MRAPGWMVDLTPLRTSREFRLLFAVRIVSLLGIGLATVAIPIQVFDLSGSSLQVAAVGAVLGLSMLVALLYGGVLADTVSRRTLVVWSRGGATAVFALLVLNAALPEPQLWLIYVAAVANGATAVGQTAMTALSQAVVERSELAAAGALLALSTQIGAVVGPLLGGVLIAATGLVPTYAAIAVATAAGALLATRLRPTPVAGKEPTPVWRSMREGAAFMWGDRVVRGVLLVDVAAMVFAMPRVLFPQLTAEVFGGGPATTGALYSASAVGALLAALVSGWISRPRRSGLLLLGSVVLFGAATGLVGLVALPVALVLLAVAGAADTISEILRRALLSAATPDHLQGRVSGIWLAQAMVGPSAGGVEAGLATRLFAPGPAIALGGAVCVLATGLLGAVSRPLRRASLSDPAPHPH